MRLIIGAGKRHKEGWTHHDIQKLPDTDIQCDFWELPKHVKRESCEEIETTHFLEHIPMAKTQDALLLIKTLLQPGGKLYIEVPNFYWQALGIISNPLDRQMVTYAFGGQLNDWDYHYNGFTPEILNEDLVAAGFVVEMLNPNSSLEAWAIRP